MFRLGSCHCKKTWTWPKWNQLSWFQVGGKLSCSGLTLKLPSRLQIQTSFLTVSEAVKKYFQIPKVYIQFTFHSSDSAKSNRSGLGRMTDISKKVYRIRTVMEQIIPLIEAKWYIYKFPWRFGYYWPTNHQHRKYIIQSLSDKSFIYNDGVVA